MDLAPKSFPATAPECLYTPEQIALAWHLDPSTVRRLFADERGVLKFGRKARGKRTYTTLRIPCAVLDRVVAERSK